MYHDLQKVLASTLGNIPVSCHDTAIYDISNLEEAWDVSKNEIYSAKKRLQTLRTRWKEFDDLVDNLEDQLRKTNDAVATLYDANVDVANMEMLLKK